MRPSIARSWLCLTLAGGLLASCSDGNPDPPTRERTDAVASVQVSGKIAQADELLRIAHTGVRKVEVYDRTKVPARYLAYREKIVTDGRGHYSVEPVEPLTEVTPNWASFQLLQRVREGYVFRYRDFAIRDEELFARNYVLTDLAEEVRVAGRPSDRYRAERLSDGKSYDLTVDRETGIVLRYEEHDPAGELLSAMEYETFGLAPDTSGVRWHTDFNQERSLDWSWDLSVQLGVHTDTPRILPEGYALRDAARVVDGNGDPWLKLVYVDGVEPLFFLLTLPEPLDLAQGGAQALDTRTTVGPGTVSVFQMGAARAAQGTMGDYRFIAVGKVEDTDLLDMIESALP